MTNKARATASEPKGGPDLENWAKSWAPLLQANRAALDYWATVTGTAMKGLFEMSQQMVHFAQVRLSEDVKVCESLSHCKNPGETLECQKQFTEKATTQYLEQANALSSLMAQISTDSLNSVQRAMAAGERNIASRAH